MSLPLYRRLAPWTLGWLLSSGCNLIAGIDDLGPRFEERPEPDSGSPFEFDGGIDAGSLDAALALCTTHDECALRLGEPALCHAQDGSCVKLFSEECTTVTGPHADEGALVLGSIGPQTGPNASTGQSNRWGIELAVRDFALNSSGLPPIGSGARRPIVVVHCDDGATVEKALKAARHLTDQVGVSAIIGPSFSGITVAVANQVAVPAGVLLMSPAATSAALTGQIDQNLLWRTAPSDVTQAAAQTLLATLVRDEIRILQRFMDGYPMKLAMLHKGDSYGLGLTQDVARRLIWNDGTATSNQNAPFVMRFDYGDPGNPIEAPPRYGEALQKTLELLPHVILLYGTAEVAELMRMIEQAWPADYPPRPHYLLSDGGHTMELGDAIAAIDPAGETQLAERVIGTEPGSLGEDYELFQQLYTSKSDSPPVPITFGSANAYDALYVLAYAAVAAGQPHPTGAELALGISRLVPAEGIALPTPVGGGYIADALRILSTGGRIDLTGASGPLDFDLETGDVVSGILLWCPQVGLDRRVTLVPTREAYDPVLNEIVLVGAERARCGQPELEVEPEPVPTE